MPPRIELRTVTGGAILPLLPALAALRIAVFREFPYLYDGDVAYEEHYLRIYAEAPDAAVIVARDGADIVGASTCLPLAAETQAVRAPFADAGWDGVKIFYFGESVLLPPYRGQGIGVGFFRAREAQARATGHEIAAFCAVRRAAGHPARPAGYVPLDAFWTRRGYTSHPELQCRMAWRDVGDVEETEKTLTFWTRDLTK